MQETMWSYGIEKAAFCYRFYFFRVLTSQAPSYLYSQIDVQYNYMNKARSSKEYKK